MPADLDILYEQGPVLALNKPSGLATQAPPGIDSLEARIKAFIKEREHKPGGVYLGVPHRRLGRRRDERLRESRRTSRHLAHGSFHRRTLSGFRDSCRIR